MMNAVEETSKPQPLREQAYDTLRQRIFDGYYVPGTRLVERTLADEFCVSRLPIREALRMLRHERLVVEKGRGVVVAGLSEKEVRDLFDLREALEVLACRLAAERASAADLDDLSALLEAASNQLAAGRFATAQRINSEFHDRVNELADNDLLRSSLEPLTGRLHWLFRHAAGLDELIEEHRRLLAAIASGDPDRAARQSEKHIAKYKEQFARLHADIIGGHL